MSKKNLAKISIGLTFALIFFPHHLALAWEIKQTFPRLANYFLSWTISDQEAEALAKWDILILDPETKFRSEANLKKIKALNPKIIILAYVPASEIRQDWPYLEKIAPLRYKLASQISPLWYLKDEMGNRKTFWPGTIILNVSDKAPLYQGKHWNDYLVDFVSKEILSDNFWDGVFYDNAWDDIFHFAGGPVDLDNDGKNDQKEIANADWQAGLKKIYQETKKRNPLKLVVANEATLHAKSLDGVFLENFFRERDWTQFAKNLNTIINSTTQKLAFLNANSKNIYNPNDYSLMRYGLGTALLFDAFYSFDFGDQNHGQTWWYDEYEVYLGNPLNKAQRIDKQTGLSPGLWRRDFENGVVILNSTNQKKEVQLNAELELIKGKQDPEINNGLVVSKINLSGFDGLILRKPLEKIINFPFLNGAFYRVFNYKGETTRNGFFSLNNRYPTESLIAETDLDGDKKMETIVSLNGVIKISFGNRITLFSPFGAKYKGKINFAVADLNNDGLKEIVLAKASSGGEVKVYKINGEPFIPSFYPYGSKFNGGINLAVGDLNGDGFKEIVVAPETGGPHVRIFSSTGKLLSGGFFVYEPNYRGGTRVAVGDLNGDGSDEIIVGPGKDHLPLIKFFNGRGREVFSSFLAFSAENKNGVWPVVTDLDKDGKMELLVTSPIF